MLNIYCLFVFDDVFNELVRKIIFRTIHCYYYYATITVLDIKGAKNCGGLQFELYYF